MICSGVCRRLAIVMILPSPTIVGNGLTSRVDRSQGVRPVGSLLGASGLVLVVALVLGDAYFAFAGAFSLVVWTLILLVGPRVDRRRVARAQRTETAAM